MKIGQIKVYLYIIKLYAQKSYHGWAQAKSGTKLFRADFLDQQIDDHRGVLSHVVIALSCVLRWQDGADSI